LKNRVKPRKLSKVLSIMVITRSKSTSQISPPAGSHASRGEGGLDNSTKSFFGVC